MKKKLFIIGCAGVPARYGGFETFVENLALILAESLDVTIICSSKFYALEEREQIWKSVSRIFLNIHPNGISSLFYDFKGLKIAIKNADYILLLGVGIGIALPFLPEIKSRNLFIHIDGLEWKRPKWSLPAKLFLWLGYLISVRYASHIILDSTELLKYIPLRFHNKVIYITYGGEHLSLVSSEISKSDSHYCLVIARAEPDNNLHLILRAFKRMKNHNLIVISNWLQTCYGKRLYKGYSGIKNIYLVHAIYDDRSKLQQYRVNCSLYIHAHSSGGTNPSLVEAMHSGVPIIAWDNLFNRATTNNMALYFTTQKELEQIIKNIDRTELSVKAKKMQDYAKQHYTWNKASKKLLEYISL